MLAALCEWVQPVQFMANMHSSNFNKSGLQNTHKPVIEHTGSPDKELPNKIFSLLCFILFYHKCLWIKLIKTRKNPHKTLD